jgi:signal transduction histidine kinase
MRAKLATKISAAVVGVVLLAILSSVAALLSSWQFARMLHQTVNSNLPSVRAAEELEIALLEQRGFVSRYMLDEGNRKWLEGLDDVKKGFDFWLKEASDTAHTAAEKELLVKIEATYDKYDASRDRAVELYGQGEVEAAKKLFFEDVHKLSADAYDLCEDFIRANQSYVDDTTARVHRETRRVTWMVGLCVALTITLGITLLWLFFFGVLLPLRRIVADAREFAGPARASAEGLPKDELGAVGDYFRALMSDVADTRSSLEASRSRLMSAEKLATVGKLAASVAHEIRNPLTSIKMWLFSIRKGVAEDPELERKVGVVSEEVDRLESIVRNFLEFTRPPAPKLQPQSIPGLIDKTLDLCGHGIAVKKIEVRREERPPLPLVTADSEQLKQVFLNLLDNALEANPEGGVIGISAEAATEAGGRRMVVVRIRDSGPGMPDDVAQRVFEPFFTTKDDGTGLGLCIAAGIMARHGGRLVLESTSPSGTVFAVWTPAAGEENREQDPGR